MLAELQNRGDEVNTSGKKLVEDSFGPGVL